MVNKYNDSVIKLFSLLKLLNRGNVHYNEVISIFADDYGIISQKSNVELNKYLNALKIYGIKIEKKNNIYNLINTPFGIELSSDEINAVNIIKNVVNIMPNGKTKLSLEDFLNNLEVRYSDETRVLLNVIKNLATEKFTSYLSKYYSTIELCESYIKEKNKICLVFVDKNGEEVKLACSPKDLIYNSDNVIFKVYRHSNKNIYDIPIDKIIDITSLHSRVPEVELSNSFVYKLKRDLAKSYKLKDTEYSNGSDDEGNLIVVNSGEDINSLISRLLKYNRNCEIITPKSMRDKMKSIIDEMLRSYDTI